MNVMARLREAVKRYDDTHNFTCDVCGREVVRGERVCDACRMSLPRNDRAFCPLCGRRVKEAGVCVECKDRPLPLGKARSALVYEGEAVRLVTRFKRGQKYLYRTLAELMLPVFDREFADTEGILFVPMTQKAQKKRGYNQSRLLAERLSELRGIPLLDALEKTRETAPQKLLGRTEREDNLRGSFRVTDRKAVKGKTLLLVDDAMTTGSTLSELCAVLKKAGAKEVNALTFASVEMPVSRQTT